MYNNSEIPLVVFMPNITTNHVITYINLLLLLLLLLLTKINELDSSDTAPLRTYTVLCVSL